MKILQINRNVNTGSTGRIAEDIGRVAKSHGYESYIAHNNNTHNSENELIKVGNSLSRHLHILSTRLFDDHGFSSRSSTEKLIQKLRILHPDIVHLHNTHGYYLHMDVLFQYLRQVAIPVIWTLHDCWPLTGHCTYFDFVNCEKWRTECYQCPNLKAYPQTWGQDKSQKNFYRKKELFTSLKHLAIVTPSRWLAQIVQSSFMHSYPVQVIHNGIDLSQFKYMVGDRLRAKYDLQDKKVIVGVANNWDKRKGLDDFLALSTSLPTNQCIALIGLNPAQQRGLPGNMIGITRTESIAELAEWYSVADAFVNPTWVDNFPTTNLEALACGTPVITYNTGGSPESIDKSTGITVEKGDITGLRRAIDTVIQHKKNRYATPCRKRAERLFDKEKQFRNYIRLYNTLTNTI